MNNLNSIGILVQHINAKRGIPIESLYFPQDTKHFEMFISTLILARNLKLNIGNSTSPLMLLQKLSIITANLVDFSPLQGLLARFDRKSFQVACQKQYRQMRSLGSMVYGIQPLLKQTDSLEVFSTFSQQDQIQRNNLNPNWRITRLVLTKMAQKSQGQIKECLQILLGLPSLTHPSYLQQKWRPIWTVLYRWTVALLISDHKQQLRNIKQWELAVQQTKEQLNLKNSQSRYSYWQRLIISMLGFIVKQFLFQDTFCLEIKQAKDQFQQIPKQFFPSTSYYTQITLLFRDLFHHCKLEYSTAFCDDLLKNIIISLSSQSNQEHSKDKRQKIFLTSYLLPKEQLPNYLKLHHLPFWNYGLSQAINQTLATHFLLHSNQIEEDIDWNKVFQALNPFSMRMYLFEGQKEWIQNKWAEQFIDLCKSPPDFLVQKVKQTCNKLSNTQIVKSLQLFGQQWSSFLRVDLLKQLNETVIIFAQKILSFNFKINQQFRKMSRFPQDNQPWFIHLCKIYFNYHKNSSISQLQILFSPSFVKNLLAIQNSSLLNSFWNEWGDYLLNSNTMIESLLSIGGDLQSTIESNNIQPERP